MAISRLPPCPRCGRRALWTDDDAATRPNQVQAACGDCMWLGWVEPTTPIRLMFEAKDARIAEAVMQAATDLGYPVEREAHALVVIVPDKPGCFLLGEAMAALLPRRKTDGD